MSGDFAQCRRLQVKTKAAAPVEITRSDVRIIDTGFSEAGSPMAASCQEAAKVTFTPRWRK